MLDGFDFNIGDIDQQIQSAASFVLRYAVVLASAGAFAMALLELAKTLFGWRTRFHAREVIRWFFPEGKATDQFEQHTQALAQLLRLCSGISAQDALDAAKDLVANGRLRGLWLSPRPEHAPFAQELEVMTGHFRDAIDLAINTPCTYEALFRFVTSGADPRDVKEWLKRAGNVDRVDAAQSAAAQHAERFSRLHHAARRKLDAFALYTSSRWVNRQQLAANALGIIILFAATVATGVDVLEAIVISSLGGILAPVAKDMVVALQQVRQR